MLAFIGCADIGGICAALVVKPATGAIWSNRCEPRRQENVNQSNADEGRPNLS